MRNLNLLIMIKVAIQGIKGSYHHQVASDYFSDSSEIIESHFSIIGVRSSISIVSNFSLLISITDKF